MKMPSLLPFCAFIELLEEFVHVPIPFSSSYHWSTCTGDSSSGVSFNPRVAYALMKHAAEGGHPAAQREVGLWLATGLQEPPDEELSDDGKQECPPAKQIAPFTPVIQPLPPSL